MKSSIFFFLFTFLTSFSSFAEVAEIFYIKGEVTVIKGDENGVPAQVGMKLSEGDEVETQAGSMAIVSFLGASKLKIDPESKLIIEAYKGKTKEEDKTFTRFYLQWGAAVIDFVNGKKEHELEVKTRQAAMAVRGTNFFVGYGDGEERGDVYTLVNEGKVSALNYDKDDYEDIPSGTGLLIDKSGGISKPEKFEWAKKLNWKIKPEAGKLSTTGFRSSELRKSRLERRQQLLNRLKQRQRKSFKRSGEFASWVKNKDQFKKRLEQRKRLRQERLNKLKNRRQEMRQNNNQNRKKLRNRLRQ
ncbi:MAG: hypothetical protein EP319_15560 [Deltaproteobacteria bacterium]|nr:MAG: hypothetical protein EP319_15560 [Deltaproteobacteria bacterium]